MALTTLAGLIAGMLPPYEFLKSSLANEASNVFASSFYWAGKPAAAAAPTPGMAGAALTTYAGQIPFLNPPSGNTYLARFVGGASLGGVCSLTLCDRLWHNSGIDVISLTAQTVNSVAWPARDRLGATNGDGVLVALEVSTATTNTVAVTTVTMDYTNQAGTASKTATMASFPATAVASTFVPFELAAGDTGVRSIQSVTLGTSLLTGTVHLVAYRPLASITDQQVVRPRIANALDLGFPRLFDNSVPFVLLMLGGTFGGAGRMSGEIVFAQG